MFSLNNINNGTLRSTKSMPQKDITSDNQSSFSMGRRKYVRTLGVDTTLVNNNIPDTIRQNIQKKWYGNSSVRDSTRVINKRVNNEVGNGSLNSSGTSMSFTSDSAIVPEISNLNAIDGSGSATLTFDIDNGGSLITNYQYAIYNGINLVNLQSIGPSINSPYLLPDSLIPGTQYKIYLTAYNKRGEGSSNTYVIPTSIPVLSAPTSSSFDYTNSIISYATTLAKTTRTAYFTPIAPSTESETGLSPIISYELIVIDISSSTQDIYSFPSNTTQFIPKLKMNDYTLSLRAYNKNGAGPYSNSSSFTIDPVPPYNIDLSAIILVDASNISFYNKVNFTNPKVPTIDISFRIVTAPTNNGGSPIVGYNYNCSNITTTLTASSSADVPQRNVITLNANTLNTINIYARNSSKTTNGIAIKIPKTITYTPFIPPPKPIITSASVTGSFIIPSYIQQGYYLSVRFTGSNDYPSDSVISSYECTLKGSVGQPSNSQNLTWTNIRNADVMDVSLSQLRFANNPSFSTYYRKNSTIASSSQDGLIYYMYIRPISTNNYFYPATYGAENTNFLAKTNAFMFGTSPILLSVKYIPGDKKVVLYDFSLNPRTLAFLDDFVVYSYRVEPDVNWSTTDVFVNATLQGNDTSYNLQVRAHNNIGISTTHTIVVRGQSKPHTPVMAVYQYLSGVLLVATPGSYVSKYLDEVMYSYDKYSVNYSYSFDGNNYINFPHYPDRTNRAQVFIKNLNSGTTYTLYLISTSIKSDVSSNAASTTFTFTPVNIGGNGKATTNYKTFKIGDLRYMIWPNTGDISFNNAGTIEILMIGAGGAGSGNGAGGGAGEVLNGFIDVSANKTYSIKDISSNVRFDGSYSMIAYAGGAGAPSAITIATSYDILYSSSGGGNFINAGTTTGNVNTLRGQILNTRPYIVSNNNSYIYSYGGNLGSNALIYNKDYVIMYGGGGGSGTPARLSMDFSLNIPGGGTNKVSDWILDISTAMNSIKSNSNEWSDATIKNGIGYIASGGAGVFNGLVNDKIENFTELTTTSQVLGYGGGAILSSNSANKTGTYNTGSGCGGSKTSITSGLVVIRYYE